VGGLGGLMGQNGGLGGGLGGTGGLSSGAGGSLHGSNGMMNNFVRLSSLTGAPKSSLTALGSGDNVAGLQHLLEAAQRQQKEEGQYDGGRGHDSRGRDGGGGKRPRVDRGGAAPVRG